MGKIARLERNWESILNSLSNYPSIGYWVLEEIYKYEDGLIWLEDMADLEPDSVKGWISDPETGKLTHVQQYGWSQGEKNPKPLPAHKALIVCKDKTGRNWEGVGMLRSCVSWYELTNVIQDNLAYGAYRWGKTIPKVRVNRPPQEALDTSTSAYTEDEINEQIEYANATAQALSEGRATFISDTPIAQIETYGDGNFGTMAKDLRETIVHANQEMSTRYAAQWLELGVSNTGSRNVGEVHYEAFRTMMINLIDEIVNSITGMDRPGQGTIYRLLAANFYPNGIVPPAEMPIVSHSGLTANAIADGLAHVINLVNQGILKVDNELENAIRKIFGLSQVKAAKETQEVSGVQD